VTRPATRPRVGAEVRRRGAVYGITCVAVDRDGRPIPGRIVVGYVGQTRQTVKQREDQHRLKPFADLIIGGSWTIEEGYWTDAELDAKELYYIGHGVPLMTGSQPQRPVYNHDGNLDNPERVEIWRQVKHRQAREPGWVPPPKGSSYTPRVPRQRSAPPSPARRGAVRRRVRWTKRRIRLAVGTTGWVAVAIPVAVWTSGAESVDAQGGLLLGAASASLVVGGLLRKRRRRRR
jgi:hypothetical protein